MTNTYKLILGLIVLALTPIKTVVAAELNCSVGFQIKQSFANGARWEMCWERTDREGIIFRDIHYTTVDGVERKVLAQANVAQIHVPYDDDGARYHDVSDYGLGFTEYLNDLTPADCPQGDLLRRSGRDILCKSFIQNEVAAATMSGTKKQELLSIFSVSHVGEYNYIPDWRFLDDGSIEPWMGATGRLQRYVASDTSLGWRVNSSAEPIGVSHTHNYYWKLDFDIGTETTDEVFEEINFIPNSTRTKFEKQITSYNQEVARSINSETKRFWRVKDKNLTNTDGQNISYEILAVDTGHKDYGPDNEPWTQNDIYASQYRACERFGSKNPQDIAGGCPLNGNLATFVNGENLENDDLVVWFGLTFHHIPRDEDESYMHSHWNHFKIRPRDVSAGVPASNTNPIINSIQNQTNLVGSAITLPISASDADGDTLTYSAEGLPNGLTINPNTGVISGTTTLVGSYAVVITVNDGRGGEVTSNFNWLVNQSPNIAPTLVEPDVQYNWIGDTIDMAVVASDPNSDPLIYSENGLPDGLAINANTGVISGEITQPGEWQVELGVLDGRGGSDTVNFVWTTFLDPECPAKGCINYISRYGFSSYADQDIDRDASPMESANSGRDLILTGNRWVKVNKRYPIYPDTVLEFEFKSTSMGEIHGIGFDADNNLSEDRIFNIYGSENWGMMTYAAYTNFGEFQTIRIPVGQYYSGEFMHLVIVNDKDAGVADNTSVFRNVRMMRNQ